MLREARLRQLLDGAPRVRVAIVGDFVLDRYLLVDPAIQEVSLETGQIAHQVVAVRESPGHGGTVASNLRALGVERIVAVGAVGDDGDGYALRSALARLGADAGHLTASTAVVTGCYVKPLVQDAAGAPRELERLDLRQRVPLPAGIEAEVIRRVRQLTDSPAPEVDAVVIADQFTERNCGVITDAVREELCAIAVRRPGLVWLADSRARIGEYHGVSLKPNRQECLRSAGGSQDPEGCPDPARLRRQAIELARRAGRTVFVTCGEDGLLVVDPSGRIEGLAAAAVDGPTDPTGAGDSTTSGIVVALCQRADPIEAAALGVLVAGVTVKQLGTTGSATPEQILDAYHVLARSE